MNMHQWAEWQRGLRFLWGFVLLPAFLVSIGCARASALTLLVENGQPRAEIVIAEQPARMTRLAASELQTYIKKISGAVLPIVTEPSGEAARIYVGISPHTEALGLETEGLKYGAYRMASGPDWLALLGPDKDFEHPEPWARTFGDRFRAQAEWDELTPDGDYYGFPYTRAYQGYIEDLDIWLNDDGGTFNAVCDFLRDLGVRWYFPGKLGEVVPELADIPLPEVDRTARPDFDFRSVSYWVPDPDTILWTLRLGGFAGLELHGTTQLCHGMKFITMRDEVKQAHPEWYALFGDRRGTDHTYAGAVCLSSEGLFNQQLKFARWMFDERDEPMISLDPADGFSRTCQCEDCAGKITPERGWGGAMSDYVFDYIQRVADALYQSHPERMVSALSYGGYQLPPKEIDQFSPNLALWICQWRSRFHNRGLRDDALQLRRDWLEKLPSDDIYIYEYYLHNAERYGYAGIPVYFPRLIAEDLHALRGVSRGEFSEVYMHRNPEEFAWHPLAVTHLNIYVTLRLLWDLDQDLDAMLDEFYTLFYGPAAVPMKNFIDYSEANWPRMRMEPEVIGEALELLSAAEAAVPAESVYGKRIALVSTYLDLLRERKEMLATYRKDVPVIRIATSSGEGLTVDGRLDDPFWKDVPVHDLRELESGVAPRNATSIRLAWGEDNRSLVLGIRCEEPDMAGLHAGATLDGDTAIFNDDAIELFIETPFHAFYQIAVNTLGVVLDIDRKDGFESRWSFDGDLAVHRGEDYWSLEIRLPTVDHVGGGLDPLHMVNGAKPTEAEPWYVNVCRGRPRSEAIEKSALSPTGHSRFGDPSKFARLIAE